MPRIIFSFIVVVIINFNLNAQCNIDDYKGLRALYFATNGDNWKNRINWDVQSESPKSNCNLSKFYGVNLNEIGRVNLIGLAQNNLTGSLPAEIKNLKYLNTLWLDQNAISGNLPKEFGDLQYLERLALSYNQFTGILPQEIFSMKSVKEFSLEVNKFEGSIPSLIGNFTDLKRLNLSNNNLSGTLPKEIGELKFLENINLSNNDFEGCYPSSFKNLCSKTIDFSGNYLLAKWQSFCNNPSECKFDFKEVNFEMDTLYVSQSPKKKQIIFISEGFTKEEFPKFKSFVVKATSKLKELIPNISFEVILALVPSNQSGVSNTKASPAVIKDTYFETDLVPHVVYGTPSVKIKENIAGPFVKKYFPEKIYPVASRIITYVVNTDLYGGYTSSIEGVFTNKIISIEINTGTLFDSEWVFAHELGHFFGHADIQDALGFPPQGEWANATKETDRNKIKWKQYIKASTPIPTPKNSGYDNEIGLFSVTDKDGNPTGWYRPCNNACIMRTPASHGNFCQVCGGHLNRSDNLPFLFVENGKYGGYFLNGNRISVKADPPQKSFLFSHWQSDDVVFENPLNPITTFLMPNINLKVKANYKNVVLANELPNKTGNVQIYPNPILNRFNINFNEPLKIPVKLILVNSIGTMVKEWTTDRQNNIFEIQNLLSGVYFLQFEINGTMEVLKLLKN